MQPQRLVLFTAATLGIGLLSLAPDAVAANEGSDATMDCHMIFTLRGWSALYKNTTGTVTVGHPPISGRAHRLRKTTTGSGTVACANGQTMRVNLTVRGGHGSVGKYELGDGYGVFSNVTDIDQVLGTYSRAATRRVGVKGAHASAMAKGGIALVISGGSTGWNVGTGFPSFAIETSK
jgi:hypothetical protein